MGVTALNPTLGAKSPGDLRSCGCTKEPMKRYLHNLLRFQFCCRAERTMKEVKRFGNGYTFSPDPDPWVSRLSVVDGPLCAVVA